MQILSGVQEGEQVVTSGGLGLDDKAKVAIQQPKPEDEDEDQARRRRRRMTLTDAKDAKGKDAKGK